MMSRKAFLPVPRRLMFGKEVMIKAQPAKVVVKAFPVKAVKNQF